MAKKELTKIGDRIIIYLYDNGYMVEADGRIEDDWSSTKVVCTELGEVHNLIDKYTSMERDN